MKSVKILFILVAIAGMVACTGGMSKEQLFERAAEKLQSQVEKGINERIKRFMDNNLEVPGSYEPVETRFMPLSSNMLLANTNMYQTVRQLRRSCERYRYYRHRASEVPAEKAECAEAALRVFETEIDPNLKVLADQTKMIRRSAPEFAGLRVEHTCKVTSKRGKELTRSFTFIIRPDESIALLDETDTARQVELFLDSLARDLIVIELPEKW